MVWDPLNSGTAFPYTDMTLMWWNCQMMSSWMPSRYKHNTHGVRIINYKSNRPKVRRRPERILPGVSPNLAAGISRRRLQQVRRHLVVHVPVTPHHTTQLVVTNCTLLNTTTKSHRTSRSKTWSYNKIITNTLTNTIRRNVSIYIYIYIIY